AEALRREFSKLTRGHGRRYPPTLREQATTWAQRARRSGVRWHEIAETLGVNLETLRVWCRDAEGRQPTMRRVVISEERATSVVSVVAPSGLRIEGLSLRDAIAVLEKLG